jgi:HD-GYP domain-containing protein (c-di-GMP phosphodiesterase class II)
MKRFTISPVIRIIVVYLLFGGLWIAVSDRIVETLVADTHSLTAVQTYKGWLFVAASAILLYLVTQREFRTRARAEAALRESEKQARSHLEHLTTLHAIDLIISSNLDIRLTLQEILDLVISQLHVDAADVLLLNSHTQMLECVAMQGFRDARIRHSRLRLGEGIAGRAAIEQRSITVPDLYAPDSGYVRTPLLEREAVISSVAVPLIAKGQVKGVLEVMHRSPMAFHEEWMKFLEGFAAQAAIAIDNATLFNDLQRSAAELILAYDTTIEGWARALELRDQETVGHTQRATEMTLRIARAMGLSEEELVHIRRGSLLHDIGKMSIPDSILLKTGPLTDEERAVMRLHPVHAFELLVPIPYLRPAIDIPYCHHERWDGMGYPRGLKGEQIPLAARIFALADTWDALYSDRRYHTAWSEERVREYISSLAGSQFDPKVVDVFLGLEQTLNEQLTTG